MNDREAAIEARKRIAAVIYYARTRIDLDQASAGTREADAAFHDADALIAAGLIRETDNTEDDTDDAVRRIVQVVEDNKAAGTASYFIRKVPDDLDYQRDWYAVAAVNALITGGWSLARSSGVADTVKEENKQ